MICAYDHHDYDVDNYCDLENDCWVLAYDEHNGGYYDGDYYFD